MARIHIDNPMERLLVQAIRGTDMSPLPPGTLDHLGTGECRWVVTVKAYTVFWLYRTLVVRCGSITG